MVGRDIGTVVMPEAELKIFLQASLDERARRRAAEAGPAAAVERVRDEIARRDGLDRHVMEPAADAVLLATDGLSPADEVAWILDYIARNP
jgi:cytidylate kinase